MNDTHIATRTRLTNAEALELYKLICEIDIEPYISDRWGAVMYFAKFSLVGQSFESIKEEVGADYLYRCLHEYYEPFEKK
jgi:hypothetical protein